MIERDHDKLSVRQQCKLIGLPRAGVYRPASMADAEDLSVMVLIDKLHLQYPFYGSRKISFLLERDHAVLVDRKRVVRLMRLMGIEALYCKPKTSIRNAAHKVYPYLLKGLIVQRPGQVWCCDITYIPLADGYCYLVAVMDWYSRKVLSFRLSNTLDSTFCCEALENAISDFGAPEIFNTDQGCQFTSEAWTSILKQHDIRISMDGKGRYLDNIFIERLWRSVKYEEVYLHAYSNMREARDGIAKYLSLYNEKRPHQALDYLTPNQVYEKIIDTKLAA